MIWPLAVVWVFLNLIDVSVSWAAVQAGASEVGFLYQITGSFWAMSAVKLALALLVVALLVLYGKTKWLAWLNWGMFLIVVWNGFALAQQI